MNMDLESKTKIDFGVVTSGAAVRVSSSFSSVEPMAVKRERKGD
jgi:hypothetical protein